MKKLSKKAVNTSKGLMIVMVSVMGTITLAACSINYSGIAEGINQIGRGVDHAVNGTTEATTAEPATSESSEETEESEPTEEITPTPTATPTPKPTATPTPMPERVDFSELTTDSISDSIEVATEDFSESFHDQESNAELAYFNGCRMLVSVPDSVTVQTAMNLLYDAFYHEAEGVYNRYKDEAAAAYTLDPEAYTGVLYGVNINYKFAFNGRLLSVDMSYEVTDSRDQENMVTVLEKHETVTCDVYTGQFVNLQLVAKDVDALESALAQYFAAARSTDGNQYNASMVSNISLVAHANEGGTNFAVIRGTINGEQSDIVVDLTDYADYLNSYGKIVYKINR